MDGRMSLTPDGCVRPDEKHPSGRNCRSDTIYGRMDGSGRTYGWRVARPPPQQTTSNPSASAAGEQPERKHPMTDAEHPRQNGLGHALQEFKALLAAWCSDEEPEDIDDLPVYWKQP